MEGTIGTAVASSYGNYVNSPACQMLATHCGICLRPLLDAKSVERGIGPICWRDSYEEPEGLTEELRKEANAIVHYVAIHQKGDDVKQAVRVLDTMGFHKLAARIMERLCTVRLSLKAGPPAFYELHVPYSGSVFELRQIPGRRWDPKAKLNLIPASDKTREMIWDYLRKNHPGVTGVGPDGIFEIPPFQQELATQAAH